MNLRQLDSQIVGFMDCWTLGLLDSLIPGMWILGLLDSRIAVLLGLLKSRTAAKLGSRIAGMLVLEYGIAEFLYCWIAGFTDS